MTITATGTISVPPSRLKALLASLTPWAAWVGGDPTAAIYPIAAPADATGVVAGIDIATDLERTRDGVSGERFTQTGGLLLYIRAPVTPDLTEEEAFYEFCNPLDDTLAALEVAPNQAGIGLTIVRYRFAVPPTRMPLEQRDAHPDVYEAVIALDVQVWP